MSTPPQATRIDLATAMRTARWLQNRWQLEEDSVVGSLRRLRAEVGDLEFIAPMPELGQVDELYERLRLDIAPPLDRGGDLFDPEPPRIGDSLRWLGIALKGFRPGMRYCQLLIRGASNREAKVEIYRYDAGPQGNKGWVQVMRTGPEAFGKGLLSQYKALHRIPSDIAGSDKGYLLSIAGERVPTPTELDVFSACRCLYVEPQQREEDAVLGVDWASSHSEHHKTRLRRAMMRLEIPSILELDRRWKAQQAGQVSPGIVDVPEPIQGRFDASCTKCGRRFGWQGAFTDKPACPNCGHQDDSAKLARDAAALEQMGRKMDRLEPHPAIPARPAASSSQEVA